MQSGKTEKQKQTVMSFLKDKKVKWMHSFHVDDAKVCVMIRTASCHGWDLPE